MRRRVAAWQRGSAATPCRVEHVHTLTQPPRDDTSTFAYFVQYFASELALLSESHENPSHVLVRNSKHVGPNAVNISNINVIENVTALCVLCIINCTQLTFSHRKMARHLTIELQ